MHRFRPTQSGSVLPICLAIGTLIALTATQVLSTTRTDALLGTMRNESYRLFVQAEQHIDKTLQLVDQNPAWLPTMGGHTDIEPADGETTVSIHGIASDHVCENYTNGRRDNYEIRSSVTINTRASSTHIQGFSICSEQCATVGCIGVAAPLVRTYWTITEPQEQ